MIKIIKPRYKICFKLKENIYNNNNIYKLKTKKWKFIKKKRIKENFKDTLYTFKNRFMLKHFFKLTKNLKQKLLLFYGPMKSKNLKRIIKKNFNKNLKLKLEDGTFNTILQRSTKYNNLYFFIKYLESFLSVTLIRSNLVSSIFLSYQLILHKKVLVNSKIITNPRYILKPGDIISFTKDAKKYLKKKKQLVYYTTFRNKHLLINFSKKIILFCKFPDLVNLQYFTKLNWKLIFYYNKIKRL